MFWQFFLAGRILPLFLKPEIVARSARSLFKTGHSECLVFFVLKRENASTQEWARVTSSNTPPDSLKFLAAQPPNFATLVLSNLNRFANNNTKGLPTEPGRRGSAEDYGMYFPIAEESQYLLRKNDCNRNAVYSNITGGRNAANSDKATLDRVLHVRDPDEGPGKLVKFQTGYEHAAYWYYGPTRGTPLQVPLEDLAIWLHRMIEFDAPLTIERLVDRTEGDLHLTQAELHLLFRRSPQTLGPEDYVDGFDSNRYFTALCIPEGSGELPQLDFRDRDKIVSESEWHVIQRIMGYSEMSRLKSGDAAKAQIDGGERNLLLLGPPRTGKSTLALDIAANYLEVDREELLEDERFLRVQFHQAWTYGAFIRRISPRVADKTIVFETQNGVFLSHCRAHRRGKSVVVIDEINRANVAEVLGEAFQVMEVAYRDVPVALSIVAYRDEAEKQRWDDDLVIPKDMLLLFTANDLDRSTIQLDFAFLERVATIRCDVDYAEIRNTLIGRNWNSDLATSFVSMLDEIEKLSGFPIGQGNFYTFGDALGVKEWYLARLRPVVSQYLTRHRSADLIRIDALIEEWDKSQRV